MRRTTRSGDLTIAYEDCGSGSPAVVLIHGAYANRGHYAPQIEHLSTRRRVLAVDVRGHGDSDMPRRRFGIREAADDVSAVCEAAGVSAAVHVGHSWAVPLQVAAARPDLVAAAVLLDGPVLLPEKERREILAGLVPVLEGPGWMAAMQGFLGGRGFPYDASALKTRVLEEIARGPAHLAAQLMREVMSSDWSEQLASLGCPLLYVHGVMPIELERLRQLRPDAIVAAVAGGGHYLSLEVPEQVNAMLDRFLELTERGAFGGGTAGSQAVDQPVPPQQGVTAAAPL